MTYCKISVVYSSHLGKNKDLEFEKMLKETSGLSEEQLEIRRYENYNQYSLTEVYNLGLKESVYPVVLFIHNDTRFVKKGWGITLLDKFNSSDYGILGLAGSNKMMNRSETGERWIYDASQVAGLVYHPDGAGGMKENRLSNRLNFIVPAVSVDGVFIAVVRERLALAFDEDFKGFHFYDLSFCIRNFEKGVKVGIISDDSILLYHHSTGRFGKEWNEKRLQFIRKYRDDYWVPIRLSVPATHFDFSKFPLKKVHVIILTKDKTDMLFQCLDSIAEKTTYPFFSVWVADTGSSAENIIMLKEKIGTLNKETSKKFGDRATEACFNLVEFNYYNFSKINNEVVRMLERSASVAADDFLLFCNNDVKLLNDGVGGCVNTYYEYNRNGVKIGTIGIRLHHEDNTIQHCGMMFTRDNNRIKIAHKYYSSVYRYIDGIEKSIGNTGAFMFTPYRVFKDLGMFNEKYFEIYQDAEYNLNGTLRGYTNIFVGNLVAYHFESQTRGVEIPKRARQILKDEDETFFPFLIKNHRKLLTVKEMISYHTKVSHPQILTLQTHTVRTRTIPVQEQNLTIDSVFERYLKEKQQGILQGRDIWQPLVAGDRKERIMACLEHIAALLKTHAKEEPEPGLYFGETGISLFLFNYSRLTGKGCYEDLAYEILERVTSQLGRYMNRSFIDGLCGICWYIEYLAQNRFIENNTRELFTEVDRLFKNPVSYLLDFRLSSGWLGYGMYYLSRIKNPDPAGPRYWKVLSQIVRYLDDFLPENPEEADEPENLTVMQGYLGVIPFLCQLYRVKGTPYLRRVIDRYVDFILRQEQSRQEILKFPNQVRQGTCCLQWNSGDLAVANVLLQAARVSGEREWELKALQIALRTTLIQEIGDPADYSFGGTAGIAHLYNRLYQYYRLPELKEAAVFWLNKTLQIMENSEHGRTDYGLVNGLSGTALVFMGMIAGREPVWDSALLS